MSSLPRDRVRMAFLTVLGCGYARPASGTWASLAAVVFYAAMWQVMAAFGASKLSLEIFTLVGILIASVMSVRWGTWAIQRWGADPKYFVLDEFAGQWLSMLFLPFYMSAGPASLLFICASQLFLFRLFDVVKPPPARQLEALPMGWGVLMDDLFAGVYANIAGQLIWRFSPLLTWFRIAEQDFTFYVAPVAPAAGG